MVGSFNITERQLLEGVLAVPAFVPVMFCPGYVAAWFTNLHDFRKRSLVERIFWSVPLSISVSAISSELIGRFLSLAAVVGFFIICLLLCAASLLWEWRQMSSTGAKWQIGLHPLGGKALALAAVWVAIVLLSLVDIQSGQRLFLSDVVLDQGYRVHWTETVLSAGIPPTNPLYLYGHPAPMRNYYFWYAVCAAVVQMTHLTARAVLTAGCAWAGLALMTLNGLYLKHFLRVKAHLRDHFIRSMLLITVSGLGIAVVLWRLFYAHAVPDPELEFWSLDPIFSWLNTLLWAPNHIAGLVCCMTAFLLTWLAANEKGRAQVLAVVLSATAIAGAAGLSGFVTFAFFLVMIAWAAWRLATSDTSRPVLLLAVAGVGAGCMLIPYLHELTQSSSGEHASPLAFAVRTIISPDGLLKHYPFPQLERTSPTAALDLARLVMLLPGYTLELGFYAAVLILYLVPALREKRQLSLEQRTLLFFALVTLLPMSFMRSGVLKSNDFGWRAGLLLQFSLLLLGSEALTAWSSMNRGPKAPKATERMPSTPHWFRSLATLALVVGFFSTLGEALLLRAFALGEPPPGAASETTIRNFSHNAYISAIGYAQLNAAIPHDAVVQFNPMIDENLWTAIDELGVAHQIAIVGDKPWCGAELGGDPSGCASMAKAIDATFNGQSADQARATCRALGIEYLIARVYDPAWKDRNGWVWTLPSAVSDDEFRALDCR